MKVDVEITESADVSKRIHDLRAALRTFDACIQNLQQGYRFDDQLASAKIAALARARDVLSAETEVMVQILDKVRSATG